MLRKCTRTESSSKSTPSPTSGKRCLLVIDGLDEASGWRLDTSVLPHDPVPGLRIIASARLVGGASKPQDWLLRVGWKAEDTRSLEVLPLDRDGIADVLREMGVPLADLARNVDLLSELERLTEGDPLLLRFYVEDLWDNRDQAAGLRPEELRGREKGFAAYFKDWLAKQGGLYLAQGTPFDEQTIKAVLVVLACARGPLRFADLDHLVHRLLGPGRIITTDDLEPVERFLIGESGESGYALGHPKLGEYLREDFFGASETVARARTLFLAWGGDTISALNAEGLAPEETPSYLLQYYVHHLEESNAAVEQFSTLVDDGWRRAWEARDGSFQGFTNDVRLVWRAIKREPLSGDATASHQAQLVSAGVRCALCMSSVWSLGVNIPASLLQACLKRKIITPRQAIHFADLQDNLHARGRSFTAIAPVLQGEERSQAFNGAITVIGRMTHSTLQKELLTTLVLHAEPSLWNRFYKIASTIAQPQDRAQALASLALYAGEDQERARILVDVFGMTRSLAKPSMAKALLMAGLSLNRPKGDMALPSAEDMFSEALAVAKLISDEYSKVETLTQLALSEAPFEHLERACLAALDAAHASRSPRTKAHALVRLARLQHGRAREATIKDAIKTARTVADLYGRIVTMIAVSSMIPDTRKDDLIKEAFELADSQYMIEAGVVVTHYLANEFDEEDKSVIGTYINANLVRRNHMNALPLMSLDLAAKFGVSHPPSRPLDVLAPVLPVEAVEEALRLSRYISNVGEQRELLQAILRVLPDDERSEPFASAWATAMAIADQAGQTRALRELAPFASNEKQEEIFQAAIRIPGKDGRAQELGLLAPYIPGAALTRALTAIRSATDPLRRGHALAKLAPRLRGDNGDAALDEAHAAVMGGTGNQQNAQMALEIALGYSEPRRPSALLKALDWVRQSTSGLTRAMALCQFAPHLDDREERRNVLAESLAFRKHESRPRGYRTVTNDCHRVSRTSSQHRNNRGNAYGPR